VVGVLGLCSCAQKPTAGSPFPGPNGVSRSPSGKFHILHDTGDGRSPALYGLYDREGKLLATCPSIVTAEGIKVPGLPVEQTVNWSPSEKTVLIYENMSDASPEYEHHLFSENRSGTFDSRTIDLPHRSEPLPYGEWPSVDSVDDSRLNLRWRSDPKAESIPIPPP